MTTPAPITYGPCDCADERGCQVCEGLGLRVYCFFCGFSFTTRFGGCECGAFPTAHATDGDAEYARELTAEHAAGSPGLRAWRGRAA